MNSATVKPMPARKPVATICGHVDAARQLRQPGAHREPGEERDAERLADQQAERRRRGHALRHGRRERRGIERDAGVAEREDRHDRRTPPTDGARWMSSSIGESVERPSRRGDHARAAVDAGRARRRRPSRARPALRAMRGPEAERRRRRDSTRRRSARQTRDDEVDASTHTSSAPRRPRRATRSRDPAV